MRVTRIWSGLAISVCLALTGCPDRAADPSAGTPESLRPRLIAVDLTDPIRPATIDQPIELRAARDEWTSFTIQVSSVSASRPLKVSLGGFRSPAASIPAANTQVYQVLPVPVEVTPAYVRQAGLATPNRSMPSALLKVSLHDGAIELNNLRDATQPTDPRARPNGSAVLLWVDLHVPADAPAGDYVAQCELIGQAQRAIGPPIHIKLHVYDFALPRERHLQMVGNLDWSRLAALYAEQFGEAVTPSLINRRDPRYQRAVRTLDEITNLSEQNRVEVVVPGLGPIVKWPSGEPPQLDWSEYDALIGPWLHGDQFADHQPLGFWPIPPAGRLDQFDPSSRLSYWTAAATHFDEHDWLGQCQINLPRELASEAAAILANHPHVRVAVPIDDQELAGNSNLLKRADVSRLITAAPGLVSSESPARIAPTHQHWLWGDSAPSGDERDVRLWGWLAFVRRTELVFWDDPLPAGASARQDADPSRMVWLYPGEWFGVDEPLQTVQLKWLRRAEQDYEYLYLAKERGELLSALQMARLLTKPIELDPGQACDAAYSLLSGTASQQACDRAMELLAQSIMLHAPGQPVDVDKQKALYLRMLQWAQPQERPLLIPRSATWTVQGPRSDPNGVPRGKWISVRLALEIYDASDQRSISNELRWSKPAPDSGWAMPREPIGIPPLRTYHALPAAISADFDLTRLTRSAPQPLGINFINGFTGTTSGFDVVLPIAASDYRQGSLELDGKLDDWSDADAIQDGPLVLMLNRPGLQRPELQRAAENSKLFSAWGREDFYLAFALEGIWPDSHQAHNDVRYEARRAWGEDLCELLIQPLYADNTLGPVMHVVCKPGGADWVERKPQSGPQIWRPVEAGGVRYATTSTTEGRWRGELAIPWQLICGAAQKMPMLLRFNFSQHGQSNCQSATWAGPVDFGRDDSLMGVLYLRTRSAPRVQRARAQPGE